MNIRNVAIALSLLGLFQTATAQTKVSHSSVDVRTEVASALYAASATAAAAERALDDKFRAMRKKIDVLELEKNQTELSWHNSKKVMSVNWRNATKFIPKKLLFSAMLWKIFQRRVKVHKR